MSDGDDTIDLEGVRRGDAHLDEAKRLYRKQGRTPRPVPLDEIADMAKQTYTTNEVADLLDVDVQTVRRWCREGDLPAADVGRNYRVSRHELEKFWKERGGGDLFNDSGHEEIVTKVQIPREEISTGTIWPDPGQASFESAVHGAKTIVEKEDKSVRIEIYCVTEWNEWGAEDYHILFEPDADDVTAYRIDHTNLEAGDPVESVRTEIPLDVLLDECGLEWPTFTDLEGGGSE